MQAFSTAFTRGLPHGVIAAVNLPPSTEPVADTILRRLHTEERAFAENLSGHRRVEWIGGRLAARIALSAIGADMGALLPDAYGAPKTPKSISLSLSHKKNLAIALAARRGPGQVGVDFECLDRPRTHIASKILTETEMKFVDELPEDRRWTAILIHFTVKEAIYKAIAPRMRRHIGFHEAELKLSPDGLVDVEMGFDSALPIEAHVTWMPEGVIATARVRWPVADESRSTD